VKLFNLFKKLFSRERDSETPVVRKRGIRRASRTLLVHFPKSQTSSAHVISGNDLKSASFSVVPTLSETKESMFILKMNNDRVLGEFSEKKQANDALMAVASAIAPSRRRYVYLFSILFLIWFVAPRSSPQVVVAQPTTVIQKQAQLIQPASAAPVELPAILTAKPADAVPLAGPVDGEDAFGLRLVAPPAK
jgi:hypothetical protein